MCRPTRPPCRACTCCRSDGVQYTLPNTNTFILRWPNTNRACGFVKYKCQNVNLVYRGHALIMLLRNYHTFSNILFLQLYYCKFSSFDQTSWMAYVVMLSIYETYPSYNNAGYFCEIAMPCKMCILLVFESDTSNILIKCTHITSVMVKYT